MELHFALVGWLANCVGCDRKTVQDQNFLIYILRFWVFENFMWKFTSASEKDIFGIQFLIYPYYFRWFFVATFLVDCIW